MHRPLNNAWSCKKIEKFNILSNLAQHTVGDVSYYGRHRTFLAITPLPRSKCAIYKAWSVATGAADGTTLESAPVRSMRVQHSINFAFWVWLQLIEDPSEPFVDQRCVPCSDYLMKHKVRALSTQKVPLPSVVKDQSTHSQGAELYLQAISGYAILNILFDC